METITKTRTLQPLTDGPLNELLPWHSLEKGQSDLDSDKTWEYDYYNIMG